MTLTVFCTIGKIYGEIEGFDILIKREVHQWWFRRRFSDTASRNR